MRYLGGVIVHLLKSGSVQYGDIKTEQQSGLSQKRVTEIAEQLNSAFIEARSEAFEEYWDNLGKAEQEALHTIMRHGLHTLVLKSVEHAKWQGLAYQTARNMILLEQKPDMLAPELSDMTVFAEQNEFFSALPTEDKEKIIRVLDAI